MRSSPTEMPQQPHVYILNRSTSGVITEEDVPGEIWYTEHETPIACASQTADNSNCRQELPDEMPVLGRPSYFSL